MVHLCRYELTYSVESKSGVFITVKERATQTVFFIKKYDFMNGERTVATQISLFIFF